MKINYMKSSIIIILTILGFLLIYNNTYADNNEKQYIEIKIFTGELNGAGTDMDIRLILTNGDGLSTIYINDVSQYISGNAFERASVDKFSYLVPYDCNFTLAEIKIENPSQNLIQDDWYLEKIEVKEKDGTHYTFPFNRWIRHRYTINVKSKTPIINKEIRSYSAYGEVHTGDKRGAGTNANVYMTLYTENGEGPPIKLNTRISGNAFERGDIDKFSFSYEYFKEIKYINISHDNKGAGAGWFLDKININGIIFPCNCWIEGDGNGRSLNPK